MDTESDRRDLPSHCQHYHLSITGRLVFLAVIIMICVYSPTQMTHATFQFSPKEPYGHEITSEMETLAKETNFAPKIHANPVRNFSNGGAVSITIGTPTKDIERVHFQLVQQCVHEKDNYSPEFYLPMHHSRLPADHIYNSYYTVIGTQSPFANVYSGTRKG